MGCGSHTVPAERARSRSARAVLACAALLLSGCSGAPASSSKPATGDGGPPGGGALSISNLVAVESPSNVLAYDVSWSSSHPADTALDVACDGLTPWTLSSTQATQAHHVFLMGLAAGVTCTLTARSSAAGDKASAQTKIQVEPLPSFLPPIELSKPPASGAVAPGWTLIDVSSLHDHCPYTVALLDAQGRFRWYFQYPTAWPGTDAPVVPYQDGVVLGGDFVPMSYVTWRGQIVWKGPSDGTHELRPAETPGDFYYIVQRGCDSLANPGSVIAEYRPAERREVWSWKLCDHYTPPQDVADWSHMNTVALFPDQKYLVASSRNQNSIFKIERASGKLVWVMGYHGEVEDGFHGDFSMLDADRFYHQHDTTILPNGHLLMFDNGRKGVREWSRALEIAYTYNPSGQSEAHAVWKFRHQPDLFDPYWGSAQRLDNGNTLICFGSNAPGTRTTLTEVSSASKSVWEIKLPDYWSIYRAQRMSDPPRGEVVP